MGRVQRGVGVAGIVLVMALGATACAEGVDRGSTPAHSSRLDDAQVNGVRTAPDGRGIVVSYTGGDCDTAAELVLDESPSDVDVSVQVRTSGGFCNAVGIARTVSAALASPVGTREIRYGGTLFAPFDGAMLETPTALPAGFDAATETSPLRSPTPGTSDVTTDQWTLNWSGDPRADDPNADCRPGRGWLALVFARATAGQLRAGTVVDHVVLGATPVTVYEERDPLQSTISSRSLQWAGGGGSIALSSSAACSDDALLSVAQLLAVAHSLHPLT